MRSIATLGVLVLSGCGVGVAGPMTRKSTQAIDCASGQVPTYKNRFQPVGGASGVASGKDAAAGQVSADRPDAPPVQVDDSQMQNGQLTAMLLTCGGASCGDDQVAVEQTPRAPTYGGGAKTSDSAGPSAGDGVSGDDSPPPAPPITLICAEPPPDCPSGQSPQFTNHNTWECTDCAMVVSYGAAYGNYRRCVNAPTVVCNTGEVPTYVLEDEAWECKTTCDNGTYDQHAIDGVTVCVPC